MRYSCFLSDPAPASSASPNTQATEGKLFSLKKWNAVAMWSWDVECDTCAICRVQVRKFETKKFDSVFYVESAFNNER